MADSKITALTALTAADPVNDMFPVVDVSDTTMAASGTTKKISVNNILSSSPTASGALTVTGLVTAGSATITGDLTVDTTTLVVDATNNRVGVGTATPNRNLTLFAAASPVLQLCDSTSGTNTNDGLLIQQVGLDTYIENAEIGSMFFRTSQVNRYVIDATGISTWSVAGTTAMTLNSTGLGIGASPGAKLDVTSTNNAFNAIQARYNSSNPLIGFGIANSNGYAYLGFNTKSKTTSDTATYEITNTATQLRMDAGQFRFNIAASGTAGADITFTQAMTLDASGNLLVGTTSQLYGAAFARLNVDSGTSGTATFKTSGGSAQATLYAFNAATTGDNAFITFGTEATFTSRGSITYNRAGGLVAYNTTSDYRAKDIIGPVSNSGSLIDSLKVYVGKMKGATIERPMLIAHEAQEVAPYAVTGLKDEVDADGKDKYQQMDVSSFVPLLIAEIQSLRTRVQTLEAR